MAPTRTGASAKHKPRGKANPGMAAGREGPLSQTSNIKKLIKYKLKRETFNFLYKALLIAKVSYSIMSLNVVKCPI